MSQVYQTGTIKVVWVTDGKQIYSKMFDDEENATEFSKDKKDFLIFKLVEQKDMTEFTWDLLPYGRYNLYQKLFNLYKRGKLSF